jgi:hypothetical protein
VGPRDGLDAVEKILEGNRLVGKPEGKRPLKRPTHRRVDVIKIYLRQNAVVWTGLIWLRIETSGGLL